MSELGVNPAIKRIHIGPLQIGIILLTVITAGIHLYRALLMSVLRPPGGPGRGFGGGGGGGTGRGLGPGGPVALVEDLALVAPAEIRDQCGSLWDH